VPHAFDIEDAGVLRDYLVRRQRIDAAERPKIRVLTGGVSNRTVLVERETGEAWVLKQALPKLRVAVDWFSDPERIHREADGLRWLGRVAPPGTIPGFLFEDFEHHLLAMEAVPEPHENWKTMLLSGDLRFEHAESFGHLLGTIHQGARRHDAEVRKIFDDTRHFESLRLEPYYAYSASQVPEAEAFLNAVLADTRAERLTLVHGDYSPKNVLVRGDSLILLDHEVVHFGDPAFDLGFSMTHLLSKAHRVCSHREAFATASLRYWYAYREASGDREWIKRLEERAVRHTVSCLLARVAGRSPLEYLNERERQTQKRAALRLMGQTPQSVPDLVSEFIACL
jgi:aminoglycoside phosphotransferase (APT) family kinase protein